MSRLGIVLAATGSLGLAMCGNSNSTTPDMSPGADLATNPIDMATAASSFLKGNGDGSFGAATAIALTGANKPQAIVAYDVSGDGKADMLVASNGTNANNVCAYLGNGDGTFTALSAAVQQASTLNTIYNLKGLDLNRFYTLSPT